jgi:hypothetical protein
LTIKQTLLFSNQPKPDCGYQDLVVRWMQVSHTLIELPYIECEPM